MVDFVDGAREALGLAVVIDVFRAFSVACYAHAQGASRIIPVALIERARELRAAIPDSLLIGERHARPLPGFDCGNSPTELAQLDLQGRTVIHTTHSGTQGLTQALRADGVISGSLVNAGAIVNYIRSRGFERVTLVRMGHEARERCAEDDLCADILQQRLAGGSPDVTQVRELLRAAESARKFFDPEATWAPEQDFELCTRVDVFDFVLQLQVQAPVPYLKAIAVRSADTTESIG
ncbi:2-phosphosulfolactate phosphatase [Povalibacter sp.]|uniref:2-phosphosulfolactate phosphatase n=1 Tax=Povalibacter sp. TaxID=1962978 RepID=UPI002F403D63